MHIVFANRYYSPDNSATSQIVTDHAQHHAAYGQQVEVKTSRQRYDDPKAKLTASAHISGVDVHRVWTTRFGRASLPGRALDYLSFYLSFFVTCLQLLNEKSVLVCCTDPPLLSVPAAVACRMKRARLVNWLHDLYPEVAEALGVFTTNAELTRLLRQLRNRSLQQAWRNVVLGNVMAETLDSLGAPKDSTKIIHNWSLTQTTNFIPPGEDSPMRQAWKLQGQFVVAYSGNLGKAHEIDTLLATMAQLKEEPGLQFLMIGGGHHTERLITRCRELEISNVQFQDYQPLSQLEQSLALADVHLVILRPELEGCIVPSKFYGAAASGRPVIFIGSPQGEVARVLALNEAGLTAATGDGQALAAAIRQLQNNPDLRLAMGAKARTIAMTTYSRRAALTMWRSCLEEANP